MKKLLIIALVQLFVLTSFAQNKSPYKIYNAKGKQVSYKKMVKELSKSDIILFGEFHNNAISHWLQYEVTEELNKTRDLMLGAEMFEADNQLVLNEYLAGNINNKQLDSMARLWPNYQTDYAPLVDFAKDNNIQFIASNIPRRYASKVFKQGIESLDELSDEEKSWITPLPMEYDAELSCYKDIPVMMGGPKMKANLAKAQAIKDATMAYFILQNYNEGELFIHYNGAYHSDIYEGILWYLKRGKNDLNYTTISTVSQENIDKLLEENKNLADFIICVDINMTNTY